MKYTPIVLFVYNRPWHTRQTVEALLRNTLAAQSDLYIFADGPKEGQAADAVQEVRDYIKTIIGFQSVTVVERSQNMGLANSIIDGVTKVCDEHGRVVVLEDDLITSPYFLQYMNDALDLYENEEQVISVHGYMYPVEGILPETFFIRGADCWGWGTWKRGWKHFEPDGQLLLRQLRERKLTHAFDFDGAYPYTRMLKHQIAGKNNSWAVRWYASAFLNNMLTLYPSRSLVLNIGFDNSGAHCSTFNEFVGELANTRIDIANVPILADEQAWLKIRDFYKKMRSLWLLPKRAVLKLTNIFNRNR